MCVCIDGSNLRILTLRHGRHLLGWPYCLRFSSGWYGYRLDVIRTFPWTSSPSDAPHSSAVVTTTGFCVAVNHLAEIDFLLNEIMSIGALTRCSVDVDVQLSEVLPGGQHQQHTTKRAVIHFCSAWQFSGLAL